VRTRRASKTAEQNALFRALEARWPGGIDPVVDTYAADLLGPAYRSVELLARSRRGHDVVVRYIDGRWPGVRTSVVARTRLIDDGVSQVAPGVGQACLLGAGFDSRAYRLPALRRVRVFEVDHPDTQVRKRARLERAGADVGDVRFVPLDFQTGSLDGALAEAGFERSVPTLFLWEGVTNYLSETAVDATVRWCASAAPGSPLLFTYIDRHVLSTPGDYLGADRVLATVRRLGEEFTFGISPADLGPYLADRGLSLVTDVGAADYRRTYYGASADRMRGHEFYRAAHAVV
jgi:methyltransferase (TIGR00027 family)